VPQSTLKTIKKGATARRGEVVTFGLGWEQSWTRNASLTREGCAKHGSKPRSLHLIHSRLHVPSPISILLTHATSPTPSSSFMSGIHPSTASFYLTYRYVKSALPVSLRSGLTSMAHLSKSEIIRNKPISSSAETSCMASQTVRDVVCLLNAPGFVSSI
jgi:hypothetical protein